MLKILSFLFCLSRRYLVLVMLTAIHVSAALAQSIPASQTTTILFQRPGASTAFTIQPSAGAIREPMTVSGSGGTWKGTIYASNFNITLVKKATKGGKGPEFNLLKIWWDVRFGSSASFPPDIKREETPDGIKITMNNLDANMEFYRSYYAWRGKARVTLIDGEPVGKPDYYKVEFFPQQLTGSDNSKIVPAAILGNVCEGRIDKSSGNNIILNDQPLKVELLSARIVEARPNVDAKVLELQYETQGYNYGPREVRFQSAINGRAVSQAVKVSQGRHIMRIDLQGQGVPRFTSNEIFTGMMRIFPTSDMTIPPSDKKKIAVLLPLVIVPGIASTRPDNQAGDGEFDALERYLMDRSSVIDNRGGEYLGKVLPIV